MLKTLKAIAQPIGILGLAAALLSLPACDSKPDPYSGRTDYRRIDRNGDEGPKLYAKPVPGGCLYYSSGGMAFAPHPCPESAARGDL